MIDPSDQLTDLCCPICFSCFSEKENVPHILKCGHTHCNMCITSLIRRGGGKCGECRAVILERRVESLPINYSILRLIEAIKSKDVRNDDEFKCIEKKLDDNMKKLAETQELYKARVKDLHKKIDDLETEKCQMRETKQNLKKRCFDLGKSKTLDESFNIIKTTIEKVKEIDQQNSFISRRLEKGYELNNIQSIYDTPEDFIISHGELGGKCFSTNNRVYMKYLTALSPTEKKKIMINYTDLQPFITGTYMIIKYAEYFTLLEFELFKETNRAKQFLQLCMGQNGVVYAGYTFRRYERVGREGESVQLSRTGEDDPKGLLKSLHRSSRKVEYIKKGYLEGIGKGSFFTLYFEDWPCKKNSQHCFARIIKGGSILRAALRNGFQVEVTDCGLVFDPALNP